MGYTLYLKDNRAVFAVRHAKQVTRITSAELPAGRLTLQAQLTAAAMLTLSVNGQSVEPVKAPGPLAGQPVEDFNVGFDAKNPVDDYDGSEAFPGNDPEARDNHKPGHEQGRDVIVGHNLAGHVRRYSTDCKQEVALGQVAAASRQTPTRCLDQNSRSDSITPLWTSYQNARAASCLLVSNCLIQDSSSGRWTPSTVCLRFRNV